MEKDELSEANNPEGNLLQINFDSEDELDNDNGGCSGDPKFKSNEKKKKKKCCKENVDKKSGNPSKICDCENSQNCCCKMSEQNSTDHKADNKKLSTEGSSKISCSKCKSKMAQFKYRNDPCCLECYIDILEHKFKAGLRNNIKVWNHDKVLLCLSGGPNSVALVKMISETINNTTGRKMFFKADVIYIDESELYDYPESVRQERKELMLRLCKENGLKLDILDLENVFDVAEEQHLAEITQIPPLIEGSSNKEKLRTFILNLSERGSSKEDVIYSFKIYLILKYTCGKNYSHVFLGNSGQKIACQMFSEICKGRGINVEEIISAVDAKYFGGKVSIAKPMKPLIEKEILLYNKIKNCEGFYLINQPLSQRVPSNSSVPGFGNIDHLIEDFFRRLQTASNSTVHTVISTSEKLKRRFNYFTTETEKYCPLCLGLRDKLYNVLEIGSHLSLKEEISSNDKLENTNHPDQINTGTYFDEAERGKLSLCFGCRRIYENSKNPALFLDNLPKNIKFKMEEIKNNAKDDKIEKYLHENK